MDFADAVDLFNYWSETPTLTMMLLAYFGIETATAQTDPLAMAEAMRAMGAGKAEKVAKAPALDRERFAALREQLEKNGR